MVNKPTRTLQTEGSFFDDKIHYPLDFFAAKGENIYGE